jgi:hypothetical protein
MNAQGGERRSHARNPAAGPVVGRMAGATEEEDAGNDGI